MLKAGPMPSLAFLSFPMLLMHMRSPVPCKKAGPMPLSALLRLSALRDTRVISFLWFCSFVLISMAPTDPRVSRGNVASSTNPTPKRNKRAGSKRLATPQNQFSDNQTPVDMQRTISKNMDALLRVVTDLTMRISVFEEKQDQGEVSVRASPPTSPP